MLENVEPLRKILELEQQKDYSDSAVIGGLDRFLWNWAAKVADSITSPSLLSRFHKLVKSGYASLDRQQRKEWVGSMLLFVAEADNQEGGNKPTKSNARRSSRAKPAAAPGPTLAVVTGIGLNSPVTIIKGVSTGLAARFGKLGVKTVRDLLYFFPHRHLDYSQVKFISQLAEGEEQTVEANVWQSQVTMLGGRRGTEAIVGDETGNVRVVWFNQPYLAKKLATNARIVLSGRVSLFKGHYVFESPEWEPVESQDLIHTARLVPVYSLTQGLRPRQVRKLMKGVIDQWVWQVDDFLPRELRERNGLLELPCAISQAHFPEDVETKDRARVRLAFDELFLLQLGVMSKKRNWQESQPGNPFNIDRALLGTFLKSLPFELTSAQQKVLEEILQELQKTKPMCRLLQGEVGSGKTVVATAALMVAVANGYQAALMAPTEILAEQHFATICELLSRVGQQEECGIHSYTGILGHPLKVALLKGDITQGKKQEVQKQILDGEIDIIIGTHALIQKGVDFHRLGLAIVDEQHRFGVEQRSALRQKGFSPHMLVMTATPIPRTLALTLYGDLDLSVIDELPPGRHTIKTKWVKPQQRNSAYAFVRSQVAEGHQIFIICPLIEESETIAAQAAVTEYENLAHHVFPDLKLGLLHGRMSSAEKDDVMQSFRSGKLDILVSTPVVEVGIDVPNATVMMIESAERFGLSQLHQFRGRVGRGKEQSYCMLLAENTTEISRQRLDIIEKVQDGFVLAEEDLKLRGPGEFFGTRQSGLPDLRMAKLSDVALLELARSEAVKLFEKDAALEKTENQPLARELARVWPEIAEWS
ncbi:ATP-dependent DNA helicase RecG [Chloroflexota bacterium]